MSDYQRQAWLVLGDQVLYLDDFEAGYAMTELDLGYPEVRDVVNNRPNQDGTDDQTQFYGSRVVSATLTAWPGGTVALDDIPGLFGPFLRAGARPELHYTVISANVREKVLVLRASTASAPMGPPSKRELSLGWVAPDPVVRDAQVKTVTAWAGASVGGGRGYPLTFARVYPPGGGGPVAGYMEVGGDFPVRPLCQLFGPITGPTLLFTGVSGPAAADGRQTLYFKPTVTIGAGHFIELDLDRHTALYDGDSGQDMLDDIGWGETWPVISVGGTYVSYSGTTTSGVTQARVSWRDGYLT